MPQHGPAGAAVDVHPQRRGLRHRPARQEHRGRLPSRSATVALEFGNGAALAVDVRDHGVRGIAASSSSGSHQTIAVHECVAPVPPGPRLLVHETNLASRPHQAVHPCAG